MELWISNSVGESQSYTFADDEAICMGRDPDCHVVLDDLDVSRRHVTVEKVVGGFRVIDNSSNGTYVDSQFLRQDALVTRIIEQMKIGPYSVRVVELALPGEKKVVVNTDAFAALSAQEKLPEESELSTELRRKIHRKLLDSLKLGALSRDNIEDASMRPKVITALTRLVGEHASSLPEGFDQAAFVEELANEVLGLGPLEGLLADDSVSEIMVVNPQLIYCERNGKIERTRFRFTDDDAARAAIERIVTPLGRRIDESTPFVDARLKDGSRVNAVIRPLALQGACITIRKFSKNKLKIADLVGFGSLNESMGKFLERSVRARKNIVISGGTGSGKTTLLNLLSQFIPESERIVTIEDAAELQLDQEHVVSLESRPPNMDGRGEITIRDLVRNALRMRPDRILVGECRGGEAIDMLQAMNTGHDGSMTTTHANSPKEAIRRLETLVLMSGVDLPSRAIREQI
ncbi:MAG: Flp pilus assembly complex ATPase component TadA, partial [Kofleriaceae bacterium]|nr:Flp pilus assembly complex ATPase component TadA [Kofleriaceae bacterium]